MYVGRFAPSPTGALHFGSFVAALASWLDARAARGRWLLRIEDLDRPRVQPGAAGAILRALEALGLTWDEPVVYQSRRIALYQSALEQLGRYSFWCGCSRREIADSSLGRAIDGAHVYGGACRGGLPAGKERRALRIRVPDETIAFVDRVQGRHAQSLARDVGDFIAYRADGQYAYQLAVVVDDAEQRVSHVVRGADLLDSTPRQLFLQRLLGLPAPRYLHVPVVVTGAGEKLSKQTGARALDLRRKAGLLAEALQFLGQAPAESLEDAVAHWDAGRVPRRRAARAWALDEG